MQQTAQLHDNRWRGISAAAGQTPCHATTHQFIDDRRYQISNRTKVIYTSISIGIKTIWHTYSPIRFAMRIFRWQDGGVQLLDDLCRQMSQKERRIQVRSHFSSWQIFLPTPPSSLLSSETKSSSICSLSSFLHFIRTENCMQMGKDAEVESIRRHFQTLDTFWGRPGE